MIGFGLFFALPGLHHFGLLCFLLFANARLFLRLDARGLFSRKPRLQGLFFLLAPGFGRCGFTHTRVPCFVFELPLNRSLPGNGLCLAVFFSTEIPLALGLQATGQNTRKASVGLITPGFFTG